MVKISLAYVVLFFLLGFSCGLAVKMDKQSNDSCDDKGE